MKLGCCVSLNELEYVRDSDFDFIELQVGSLLPEMDDAAFDAVRQRLSDFPLPVRSFNAFLPPHIKVVGQDVCRQSYESYVTTALTRMKTLGGQRVSFGSGTSRSCPPDFSRDEAKIQIVHFLQFVAGTAEQLGIQVNVEGLNRTECNMINSVLDANTIVEEVSRPNVKLIADFYHMQMENEPLNHIIAVKNNLAYVHVADEGRLYPGSGTYPFEALVQTLRHIGYETYISVECLWRNSKEEIPLAASFLKNIIHVEGGSGA